MESNRREPRVSKRWPYAITGAALGALVAVVIFLSARPQVIYFGGGNSCCCCPAEPCYSPPTTIPGGNKLGKREDQPAPPPTTPPDDRTTITEENPPTYRETWRSYALPFFGSGGGGRDSEVTAKSTPTPVSAPGTLALVAVGASILLGKLS